MSFVSTEDKRNPLSMEIRNVILIGTYKEPKLEKNNYEGDPISHFQGYEYIKKLKCGVNDQLKVVYLYEFD